MMIHLDNIEELDFNPIIVTADNSYHIVDARIKSK